MTETDFKDKFFIREYRDCDFDSITRFWDLTDMGTPERGDNKEIIENTIKIGGTLLVVEEKSSGTISGTSWMTFDGRRILLHHFGILPEFQGKGLSKILLKKSLQFVKDKGFQVKLEVHSTNLKAINLYKRFGFSPLGDYKVFIIRDIQNL
jgi:[ribosomal protein S18]-alanine N-acetyltransferase